MRTRERTSGTGFFSKAEQLENTHKSRNAIIQLTISQAPQQMQLRFCFRDL